MKPNPVSRRHFLHAALAGGAVSQVSAAAQDAPVVGADQFAEPGRNLPLADDALPTQAEVDAGNAASAVASAAVRATRTAPSKKKAAAAAPAPTPEQPSLPFTAEAPAADPVADALVPNLADLPS